MEHVYLFFKTRKMELEDWDKCDEIPIMGGAWNSNWGRGGVPGIGGGGCLEISVYGDPFSVSLGRPGKPSRGIF